MDCLGSDHVVPCDVTVETLFPVHIIVNRNERTCSNRTQLYVPYVLMRTDE
jgi:hypothetical protein